VYEHCFLIGCLVQKLFPLGIPGATRESQVSIAMAKPVTSGISIPGFLIVQNGDKRSKFEKRSENKEE
jgi:hypothetical protein